jgi:hypothetical protein
MYILLIPELLNRFEILYNERYILKDVESILCP